MKEFIYIEFLHLPGPDLVIKFEFCSFNIFISNVSNVFAFHIFTNCKDRYFPMNALQL